MVTKNANSNTSIEYTIGKTNIYTKPFLLFFNLIKNNVIDPKDRGNIWVYGSYPKWIIDETSETGLSNNYPLIILPNSSIGNHQNFSLDYSVKEFLLNQQIEVFSDRNDYLDKISDDIINLILDNEYKFTDTGVYNVVLSSDNIDPITRSGLKIFRRIINVTYEVTN